MVQLQAPAHHAILIGGFRSVQDKNALGWAALDHKSEQLMTAAIAVSINRNAGTRIAHIEFPPSRSDLVILSGRMISRAGHYLDARGYASKIVMRYEAKAGHCFDFAPENRRGDREYLGRHLDRDMVGLRAGSGAGLFFMYEAEDPTRHLKYFVGRISSPGDAELELCRNVTMGTLVASEVMECGEVDGTKMRIHMFVFDPR